MLGNLPKIRVADPTINVENVVQLCINLRWPSLIYPQLFHSACGCSIPNIPVYDHKQCEEVSTPYQLQLQQHVYAAVLCTNVFNIQVEN